MNKNTDIETDQHKAVKSPDTGVDRPLLEMKQAELNVMLPQCLGIIRWPQLYKESMYSLYTNSPDRT